MVIALKSIFPKRQGWRLAAKAVIFGVALYFFYLDPSWWRALIFLLLAGGFYIRPLFNLINFLPLLLALLLLAIWLAGLPHLGWRFLLALILAAAYGLLLAAKNLVLIHRPQWLYILAGGLGYLTLINFFFLEKSDFSWRWLLAVLLFYLIFKNLFGESLPAVLGTLLIGQLLWVIAWLPIGFFSSANLSFLAFILLLDIFHKEQVSWRQLGLMAALMAVVLVTAYWRL